MNLDVPILPSLAVNAHHTVVEHVALSLDARIVPKTRLINAECMGVANDAMNMDVPILPETRLANAKRTAVINDVQIV